MKSINYIHERGNIPASLSNIPFFSRLRPSCLDEVLEHAGILEVEPGDSVVSEGERSHSLYFLLDGALKVYKDGSAVADIARPGELFGEISYITKEPHGATVKAERRSTVHRPVHLDAVAVKVLDERGVVVGQRLFVGLFTSAAYSARPSRIPLLRRKFDHTLELSGLSRWGHGGKALIHILNTYPRDELFQITEGQLNRIAMGILHLQERQRIAFFPRVDAFERFVSCLVYVPRDRYDTALRLKLQDLLAAAYEGTISEFYTHLTDSKLARLHFIVKTTPGRIPDVDAATLEQQLVEAGRSWSDRLQAWRSTSTARSRPRRASCGSRSTSPASGCRCPTSCRCSRIWGSR